MQIREFLKIRGTLFGVLTIRILLFGVLLFIRVPYFRKPPFRGWAGACCVEFGETPLGLADIVRSNFTIRPMEQNR